MNLCVVFFILSLYYCYLLHQPTNTNSLNVKTYFAINLFLISSDLVVNQFLNTYLHWHRIFAFKWTTCLISISRWCGCMCSDIHLLLVRPPSGWTAGIPCESRKLKGRPPALLYPYTNKPTMGWQIQTGHSIDLIFSGPCFHWQLPNADRCPCYSRRKWGQSGSHVFCVSCEPLVFVCYYSILLY